MKDLSLLKPLFLQKLKPLLESFQYNKIDYIITSTYRTREEQVCLKKEGYPTADNSPHFYKIAVDLSIENDSQRAAAKKLAEKMGFRAFDYPGHPLSKYVLHIDDYANRNKYDDKILGFLPMGFIPESNAGKILLLGGVGLALYWFFKHKKGGPHVG